MRRTGGRPGVSKAVVAIAVVAVVVIAGAYVLLTRTPAAPPSSSSVSSLPTEPVSTAVHTLIQDFNARNVDGMVSLYAPNAVVVWSGEVGGLAGQYSGLASVRLIYATTVGKSSSLDANITDLANKTVTPTEVNATYKITLLANSSAAGIVKADIDASEEWLWGSSGWQITKENWAYTYYDSSYIDAGIPSSTTFPQWGYELKGGNPNLVSEKSFEWHAGPYVAASVYAFLFGVAAVTALRIRPGRRPGPTG